MKILFQQKNTYYITNMDIYLYKCNVYSNVESGKINLNNKDESTGTKCPVAEWMVEIGRKNLKKAMLFILFKLWMEFKESFTCKQL